MTKVGKGAKIQRQDYLLLFVSTTSKNYRRKAKRFAGSLTYRAIDALRGFLNKRKWILGIAAVVLFSFCFSDWSNSLGQKDVASPLAFLEGIISPGEKESVQGSASANKNSNLALVGSALSQEGFLSSGQTTDPSAGEEDQSLCLIQENSFLAPTSPDPNCFPSTSKREVTTYTVQAGDTLEGIAIAHGINSDTLMWANGLDDNSIIKPGQVLTVLPINGVRIKIKSGDNIESIAKKYSADVKEIIAYNSLPADGALEANEYLILPGGEMPAPVSSAQPKKSTYTAPKFAQNQTSVGWLIMPASGTNWGRIHGNGGVDIANKCGTPIYAAAAGTISLADGIGWNGGYGKYIKIKHKGGLETLYGHLSVISTEAGQSVAQGQLIGYMGTTGRSTGCHVHFEVHGAKNPFAWK